MGHPTDSCSCGKAVPTSGHAAQSRTLYALEDPAGGAAAQAARKDPSYRGAGRGSQDKWVALRTD